jgi:microcystin-dependent protein
MANLTIKEGVTLSGIDSQTREVLNSFAQIGMVLPFLGPITQSSNPSGIVTTTAPDGWLLCNGDIFSDIEYPRLFQVLGYGTLPNLVSEYIVGTNSPGFVGGTSGTNTHTHSSSFGTPAVSSVAMSSHETAAGTVESGASATNHSHANNVGANIDYAVNSTFINYVTGTQSNMHLRTHQHTLNVATNSGATNDNHAHTITRAASAITQGAASTHTHAASSSSTINTPSTAIPTIYVNYIIKVDK